MNRRDMLAFELVGRVRYYRDKKLTAKEARDAIARLVKFADAVMDDPNGSDEADLSWINEPISNNGTANRTS